MTTNKRGAFIVIEGLDRSGKSTQASLLLSQLQHANVPAKSMKFPDRTTPIGQMIDAYLRTEADVDDRAIHLLFSANRWELAGSIERALIEGTTIVCDRYAFSGVAFSASKGLPFDWCRAPDVGLPAPDLTLFLHITPDKAKERGGYGEERYEKEEMQTRVGQIFESLAAEERQQQQQQQQQQQHREDGGAVWFTIDAGRSLEEVKEDIWGKVHRVLQFGTDTPIRRLWLSHAASS